MDRGLVNKGLDFSRRKKKWIILMGLVGFSSYGAYEMYHLPSVARKGKRIMKLLGSLISMAENGVYKVENSTNEIQEADNSSFPDKRMDKLMFSAGTGFVSVIVGSFARNLVLGFYADNGSGEGSNENGHLDAFKSNSSSLPRWVNIVTDDKCRVLMADCIKTFVSTAVAVYLDKTMNVNFYDEIN